MGNRREILKEIRMSKNKTLFLRDDVKDLKKKNPVTIHYKLFGKKYVMKPKEWISDDFVYDLWASLGLGWVQDKIAMRHPGA